jgi:Co/Zn/Cd efflux system component
MIDTDIGVIIAALLMLKLHSPKRFYADPATSLFISMVIFASAIPLGQWCFENVYFWVLISIT